MSKIDKTLAPYYDFGDDEVNKQYYELLAIPGRVAQAREFSTLQTILRAIVRSVGDAIMSNGDVVEGCQIIPSADRTSITVTSGKVYIDGIVTPLEEVTVPISGTGTEIVGVKIVESIVTESDDPTLRDPAQGFDNYNQPGCNRLKRELQVVINDSEASPLGTLSDGELTVEGYAASYDVLDQTLARRTYDESGSYIVNGLSVHTEAIDGDDDNYNIVVEAGKAYVLGYELKIPTARRITVPKSTSTEMKTSRNIVYKDGQSSYLLYGLPYVASISSVEAVIDGSVQLSRSSGNSDNLTGIENISRVTKVYYGDTVYTEEQYNLDATTTTAKIVWADTSDAPPQGVSYTVEYEAYTTFTNGVDYELSVRDGASYLEFIEGGKTPVSGVQMFIEYNKFLGRYDLVYIDQYGDIVALNGSPDDEGYEVVPDTPVNTLALAYVYNPPNGSPDADDSSLAVDVTNIGLTRFTMNDIQGIVDRVKKTEYNQAVLSLNDDARNRNTVNAKKGLFTDPLVDFSRIDMYYNVNTEGAPIDISKPTYSMAIDLDVGIAYLPVEVFTYDMTEITSNTTKRYNRLVTLNATGENVVLSQPNATKSFLVNPYSVFPQLPEVIVTPAVDSWVENTTVQVPVSITNNKLVKTNTKVLYNTVYKRTTLRGRFATYTKTTQTGSSSSSQDSVVGKTSQTSVNESVISEKSITYMRRIKLTVEGKNFPAGLDNIKCSFDGVVVPLTAASGTSAGTQAGTLKASESGYVKGTFTIPANIRTGVREVKLYSDTQIGGQQTSGYTLFQSSGISRTTQRTVTTVTTVLLQREVTTTINQTKHTFVDPVGQTFVLDRTTILKGIDVYFESKPSTNDSITLELRNVTNGTIGTTVYASKVLTASQINVSNNATSITRFNFDDPVVLEPDTEYAFVLRSVSDRYRIWVSEIGGKDVTTKETVLKNSYLTGVMMSSSNNSSWTVHQTTDIKFRLVEDVYASSGSIIFAPIDLDNCTRLDLVAESAELNGTSIKWEYSIDGGRTYTSISPGSLKELGAVATSVILKADFERTSTENITPLLAFDSLLLVGSYYENEGNYISLNTTGVDSYKNITLIMDTYTADGGQISPSVGYSNGSTETILALTHDNSQDRDLGNGWFERVYTGTVPSNRTATGFRLFIKATTDSSIYTPMFGGVKLILD